MFKRCFKIGLLLFVCLSFVAHAQTKLVISSFYPLDTSAGWDAVVANFKELHPDVEIEVQITPGSQYLAKLVSQVAGHTAPDIAAIVNGSFPQFVNRNILEDLTPYLESTRGFDLASFFPRLLDRYTYDGTIYGVPYDAQPEAMLFYNPALFDEAGVDYPSNTWNWDDLLAAATKLTKTDDKGDVVQYGFDATAWEYFLYGGGGALVDDVRNPTQSLLDSRDSIDAMQFYVDLMYTSNVMPSAVTIEGLGGDGAHSTLFTTGKTAMFVTGFWDLVFNPGAYAALGADMVLSPVKDTSDRVYPTGGTAYTILKSSENKELAWEFIQLFLGPDGYKAAYESASHGAIYPPAHLPSYDWYEGQTPPIVSSLEPNRLALEHVQFLPYTLDWGEVSDKCIDADIDLISRNEAEVEPTLQKIAACVNEELEN